MKLVTEINETQQNIPVLFPKYRQFYVILFFTNDGQSAKPVQICKITVTEILLIDAAEGQTQKLLIQICEINTLFQSTGLQLLNMNAGLEYIRGYNYSTAVFSSVQMGTTGIHTQIYTHTLFQ